MSIPTEIHVGNYQSGFDPFAYIEANYLNSSNIAGKQLDSRNGSFWFCGPQTASPSIISWNPSDAAFFGQGLNALGAFRARGVGRTCGVAFNLSPGGTNSGSVAAWHTQWDTVFPNFVNAMLAGTYNTNIDAFIQAVKTANLNKADFYVRIWHEAGGYWYPWSWLFSLPLWRAGYNYMVNRCRAGGLICQFLAPWGIVGNPNSSELVLNDATLLATTDGLSIDAYSYASGTDVSSTETIGGGITFARQHGLDVYVTEFGSYNNSTDTAAKTFIQNTVNLLTANADICKRLTCYVANDGTGVINFLSQSGGYPLSYNYYVFTGEAALWNAAGGGTGTGLAIVSVATGAGTLDITTTGALNVYLSQAGVKVAGSDKTPNSSGVTSYSGLAAGTYDIYAWDVAAGGQGTSVTTAATITTAAALQISSVTADNAGNVTMVTVGALNDVIYDATTGAKVAEHAPVANTWTFAGIPTGTYNSVAYDVAAGGSGNATAPVAFSVQNGGGVVDVPTPHGLVVLMSDGTPVLTAAGVPLLT